MNKDYASEAIPKQVSIGERIEIIEKQQVEMLSIAREIKGRITPPLEGEDSSNPRCDGYVSRLEEIVECNERIRNILGSILVIL